MIYYQQLIRLQGWSVSNEDLTVIELRDGDTIECISAYKFKDVNGEEVTMHFDEETSIEEACRAFIQNENLDSTLH